MKNCLFVFASALMFVILGCSSDEPQCKIPCPFNMSEMCWEDCTQKPPNDHETESEAVDASFE